MRAFGKLLVVGAFLLALASAVVLVALGVPVGVAFTGSLLVIGLGLFLGGRAQMNLDAGGNAGPLMMTPGSVLLFVFAVCCPLLGADYLPGVNAFLLFVGGIAAVFALCALGILVVNRLVPVRRTLADHSEVVRPDGSREVIRPEPEEARRAAREFFGDR